MNDGDGESGRVSGPGEGTSGNCCSSRGDFERAVAQISVAQICENEGFQSFKQFALETLADTTIRYIEGLGRCATFHACYAGRTEANVFDVIRALEDLSSSSGFLGASDTNHSLSGSGAIREIMQYASSATEIPFACPLPHFPIIRECKLQPSFLRIGEAPPEAHIPPWLPAFPDLHTYKATPVWNERGTDPRTEKIEQARQRRKAERSLVSLQQRLMAGGEMPSESNSLDGDAGDGGKLNDKGQTENPFLVPPLRFGEKKVSYVPLPLNLSNKSRPESQVNLPSVVETFGPAIESANKRLGVSISGERQHGTTHEKILPNERPAVNFRLVSSKNVSSSSLDLSVRHLRNAGSKTWFARDDEKDDKKRRAEQILKEAMENPHELAQF